MNSDQKRRKRQKIWERDRSLQTDKEMEEERIDVIRAREKLFGLKQTPKTKLRKQLKENKEILDKLLPAGIKSMEKEK